MDSFHIDADFESDRREQQRVTRLRKRRDIAKWTMSLIVIGLGAGMLTGAAQILETGLIWRGVQRVVLGLFGSFLGGLQGFLMCYASNNSMMTIALGKWTEPPPPRKAAYFVGVPLAFVFACLFAVMMDFSDQYWVLAIVGSTICYVLWWWIAKPLVAPR